MYYVFIVMPILSVTKVSLQGRYSKKNLNTFSDVLLYNSVVFLLSALFLSAIFFRQIPPLEVCFYSLASATCSVLFQTFYTLAFKNGPIAATTIINSFSLVITLLTGVIFFNESWSIFAIFGLLIMFISFYLIPARTNDKKATLRWAMFSALAFIVSGLNSVVLLFFSRSAFNSFQNEYIAMAFALATVLNFLCTLFNVKVRKEPITIKRNFELPIVALVIGIAVGLYNLLNVVAFKHFPSYIAAPVISGTIMILVMAVNSILNREKPTFKMLVGVACAVVAIILLNL